MRIKACFSKKNQPLALTIACKYAIKCIAFEPQEVVWHYNNRLSKAQILRDGEAAQVSFLHNSLGQRVFKGEPQTEQTLPDQTTLGTGFVDWLRRNFQWLWATAQTNASIGTSFSFADQSLPSWALLGEYDNGSASGNGRVEYIWLPQDDGNAIPVAMFRGSRYYQIHTDHLGTPRLIKDDSAKPVWQWAYSAFGDNKPTGILKVTSNPNAALTNQPTLLQATGAMEFNLRFPGQYLDQETGQFYNYYRNYMPGQGRYTQADPIGLSGGLNRFGYVGGNALSWIDPTGQVAWFIPVGVAALVGGGFGAASSYLSGGNPYIGGAVGAVGGAVGGIPAATIGAVMGGAGGTVSRGFESVSRAPVAAQIIGAMPWGVGDMVNSSESRRREIYQRPPEICKR